MAFGYGAVYLSGSNSRALELSDAGAEVMLSHTGTLATDGHGNGDTDRTGVMYGQTVALGADTSAAAINPFLDPTLDPANLPDGYVAGPAERTAPIY